jgi:hypothetical protein
MQLDKFISETLKGIIKGIKDTQEFAKENDAVVNPYLHPLHKEKMLVLYDEQGKDPRALNQINFDIAITATEESTTTGGGGINVLSLKIGGELSDKDGKQSVSRVQFNTYVVLPNMEMPVSTQTYR